MEASTLEGYWEPRPAEHAWIRHHVGRRLGFFVPGSLVRDPDGPNPGTLSDTRVTFFRFEDGTLDRRQDTWRRLGANSLMKLHWTGETWLYETG